MKAVKHCNRLPREVLESPYSLDGHSPGQPALADPCLSKWVTRNHLQRYLPAFNIFCDISFAPLTHFIAFHTVNNSLFFLLPTSCHSFLEHSLMTPSCRVSSIQKAAQPSPHGFWTFEQCYTQDGQGRVNCAD